MNFLAHLWLADRTRTSLAGSILGDGVRGSDLRAYAPRTAEGIRLHRRVDAATDRHPIIAAARHAFPPGQRRFAGIVLDLAADHALARRWPDHHEQSLAAFAQRCGQALATAADDFQRAGLRRPDAGAFAGLLQSYAQTDGMERALRRVASRLRTPQPLLDAGLHWPAASDALQPQLGELLDALLAVMRADAGTQATPPGAPLA